jgi:hypothetical protein
MLSFTRTISENIMNLWFELLEIMEEVNLNDESDQIIWSFSSNGKFSVHSLYAVINDHGVKPVYVHNVWKLTVPPRVQVFFGCFRRIDCSLEITWAKEDMLRIKLVCSVMNLNLSTTCFLNVVLPKFLGASFGIVLS